jgi:SMI1-KNR4 cell-wall
VQDGHPGAGVEMRSHWHTLGLIASLMAVVVAVMLPATPQTTGAPVPKEAKRKVHPDIAKLMEILPPPANPVAAASASDWATVEKDLGLTLPDDYKDFITLYGYGYFGGDFLTIHSPLSHRENYQSHRREYVQVLENTPLMRDPQGYLKSMQEYRRENPDSQHPPIWPEVDGLLVVGDSTSAFCLAYRPDTDPNKWTVHRYRPRDDKVDNTGLRLGELLLRLTAASGDNPCGDFQTIRPPLQFAPGHWYSAMKQ